MFDGNHRTGRKKQNFASRSSRVDILKKATEAREQRRILNLKIRLATTLQKWHRARTCRRLLVEKLFQDRDIRVILLQHLQNVLGNSEKLELVCRVPSLDQFSDYRQMRMVDVMLDVLQLDGITMSNTNGTQVEHIVRLLDSCKLSNFARPIQLFAVTSNFLQNNRKRTSMFAHPLMELSLTYIQAYPNYSGNFAGSIFVVRNFNLGSMTSNLNIRLVDLLHSLTNSLGDVFVRATLATRPECVLENLLKINVATSTIANDLVWMLHYIFMNHEHLFYELIPATNKLKNSNLDDDELEEAQFDLEQKYKSLLQQEVYRNSKQMMDISITIEPDYLIALAKLCSVENLEKLADFLNLLANENTTLLQNLSWKSKLVEKFLGHNRFTNNNLAALFSGIITADLMAVDDVEFHKNCQMYTQIVQILNRRLGVYYSARYDASNEVSNLSAFHYCVTLYNMLYVRYCRKPFCDSSEFLICMNNTNNISGVAAAAANTVTIEQIILALTPQAIPFRTRYTKFTHYLSTLNESSSQEGNDLQMLLEQHNSTSHTIRRTHLVEDALEQLYPLKQDLRGNVKISLVNQLGVPERGIDGGGLFREFLHDLIVEMFLHGNYFQLLEHSQQFWWNTELSAAVANDAEMLQHYEFMGMILAKAVHCGMLINTQFCDALLNTALLQQNNTLADLRNLDEEFYRNLQSLRGLDGDKLQALGLTFVSTDGATPLLPNGQNTLIHPENVVLYIHLMAHWKLNVQCRAQAKAFQQGFTQVIPIDKHGSHNNNILRLFSPQELQKLIGGDDTVSGIDVTGLKQHMVYAGGYHPSQPIMKWFWEVLEEMTPQQQRQFLKFMTSCSRQPLLGFGHLEPKPCIQQIRVRDDDVNVNNTLSSNNNVKLPTSSTCMNLLKLPCYESKELLKKKLVYAIESGVGFELS